MRQGIIEDYCDDIVNSCYGPDHVEGLELICLYDECILSTKEVKIFADRYSAKADHVLPRCSTVTSTTSYNDGYLIYNVASVTRGREVCVDPNARRETYLCGLSSRILSAVSRCIDRSDTIDFDIGPKPIAVQS